MLDVIKLICPNAKKPSEETLSIINKRMSQHNLGVLNNENLKSYASALWTSKPTDFNDNYSAINQIIKLSNDNQHNTLKVMQWNANSLYNKIDEFKDFVIKAKVDIILISETKTTDERAHEFLQINYYTLLHKSRSQQTNGCGGVGTVLEFDRI